MQYKNIIFDFDGVLVESNAIRHKGFQLLFDGYPEKEVELLLDYVKYNGGISRYEKIKYFFEQIRSETISKDEIQTLANRYSQLVKQKVIEAKEVIGFREFISRHQKSYNLAIVSGSDQEELRKVCQTRKIDHFFVEILGSPESKDINISNLLYEMKWSKETCLYIGDSINDLDAAKKNEIDFIARDSGTTDWKVIKGVTFVGDLMELSLLSNLN